MSRILALLSLVLFAGSLLTAVRSRFLARLCGSLVHQFRVHHWLGLVTGLAFLMHVFWELWQTPADFLLSMILTTDAPLLAGWVAVLAFALALFFSYRRRLPFRTWRLWHWLFPLAFMAAAYHALIFAREDLLDQLILYTALGLGVFCIVILASRTTWNPAAEPYRIHSLQKVNPSVWELMLEPKGNPRSIEPCRAGQIIYLRFLSPGFTRALHPFSVASCRLEPYLRLYIKSLGRDTSHLQDLKLHQDVEVMGPFSELKLELDREQIWIGGGIGIAPFLGFLHCTQTLVTPPIHVLHFVSRADEVMDNQDIKTLRSSAPSLTWQTLVNEKGQRPNLERLDAVLKSVTKPRIVICGPNPFMRMVRQHLLNQGLASQDIITEEFIP